MIRKNIKNSMAITILILGLLVVAILCNALYTLLAPHVYVEKPHTLQKTLFPVQSIDTMKFSRDNARDQLGNASYDAVINNDMALIAAAGATHVAIGTPYDEEFIPMLRRWVTAARAHGLSVWFRGNFSGWEGWFSYPKIDRDQHEAMLTAFLQNHSDLFKSGDIFSPCPECENGGPGDPRQTGDAAGYNQFLLDEYALSARIFQSKGLSVTIYNSMNADIARQIITPSVASRLGGTILIDHYVPTASQFQSDVKNIAAQLKTNVGVGEFGAPVPDLNGNLTGGQQASFISSLLNALYVDRATVPLVNYWVLQGGSTALASDYGTPNQAYYTVKSYYTSPYVAGVVFDPLGQPISGAEIAIASTTQKVYSGDDGFYQIFLPPGQHTISISSGGYNPVTISFPDTLTSTSTENVFLEPTTETLWYKIKKFFYEKQQ